MSSGSAEGRRYSYLARQRPMVRDVDRLAFICKGRLFARYGGLPYGHCSAAAVLRLLIAIG